MMEAARWLRAHLEDALMLFERHGYRVSICGHSLGAGCAVLLGFLMKKKLKTLHVYGYAIPPVMNEVLADHPWVQERVLILVLRDDLVPRASISNASKLLDEIAARQNEFKKDFQKDIDAFLKRARTIWAPTHRTTKVWETTAGSLRCV